MSVKYLFLYHIQTMIFLSLEEKASFFLHLLSMGGKFNHLINNLVQMTFLKNEKGHDILTVLNCASPYS